MHNRIRVPASLALFAAFLALIVVTLGAYTRISDAGLGCPDWPGCYRHLTAPDTASQIHQAAINFPGATIQVLKAWTEMIHRYIAGSLAVLILIIGYSSFRRRHVAGQPLLVPALLIGLLIFQILLGRWTVTLRLTPAIVMGHLLVGMAILALLWWLFLKLREPLLPTRVSLDDLKPWAVLGLIIVILQIALGGWTSANYASLICPNFPACTVQAFFPQVDFQNAFQVLNGNTNVDHPQSTAVLITIQMAHRLGAMLTAIYIGFLSLLLLSMGKTAALRNLGSFMLLILVLQTSLGIMNVLLFLPLPIAIAHNTAAALLLLSLVTLNKLVFRRHEGRK